MFDFNCSDGGNPGLTELSLVPLPAVPVETSLPFTGHFASEPMTSLVLLDDDNDSPKASASVRKPQEKILHHVVLQIEKLRRYPAELFRRVRDVSRKGRHRNVPRVQVQSHPESQRQGQDWRNQQR